MDFSGLGKDHDCKNKREEEARIGRISQQMKAVTLRERIYLAGRFAAEAAAGRMIIPGEQGPPEAPV